VDNKPAIYYGMLTKPKPPSRIFIINNSITTSVKQGEEKRITEGQEEQEEQEEQEGPQNRSQQKKIINTQGKQNKLQNRPQEPKSLCIIL
jgi:hypothetical protein